MNFQLESAFKPTGDQPQAIEKLTDGLKRGSKHQVLLGVTGSGKTYTIANVIKNVQKPTLVISHNKTLAAQLYQEFRDFFPKNSVSYFVSYYDYYQPEAYIPQSDTYIEKETEINEEIDKLRLSATTNLLTRKDTIVIASVSAIYNLGSPVEYGRFVLELKKGVQLERHQILKRLTDLQYERYDYGARRGTFRVKGDTLELFPSYDDNSVRIQFLDDKIEKLQKLDPINGGLVEELENTVIYPTKHYMTNPATYDEVFKKIRADMERREKEFISQGKALEAHRIRQRTEYDLQMIKELGYVNGIENYSRYFDGRKEGEPPYTLLDYFPEDYLLIIDESHMTIPQIRGMYHGDRSRKETLINYGFRLPAALDNRPLRFDEFLRHVNQVIYTSATPTEWEISKSFEENNSDGIIEQLIRPTGLIDPQIFIKPTANQINDLISEIKLRVERNERVLVTTLTKRMAEELANYLYDQEIKVHYLHSDIQTLDRTDILDDLRSGKYDVVVGINLLREGLDLPEVSLVAILDSDKEGFLRSETSLIQTMGRAARHINSTVIMYADITTGSMERAIKEVERRRKIQVEYNKTHGITPTSIQKPIREKLIDRTKKSANEDEKIRIKGLGIFESLEQMDISQLTPADKKVLKNDLTRRMHAAAKILDFETAAYLRDYIKLLQ